MAPEEFSNELYKIECHTKTTSGYKSSHLPWLSIKILGKEHDDYLNMSARCPKSFKPQHGKTQVLWSYSQPTSTESKKNLTCQTNNKSYDTERNQSHSPTATASTLKEANKSRTFHWRNPSSFCDWCGSRGNDKSLCWKKRGFCLMCGGQHATNNHHRYKKKPMTRAPCCPICSGNHLGKDCKHQQDESGN